MSAEWGRKCDYALVISIVPDVCWTPVNGVMVAVAYTIIGRVDNAIDTDPKYLICGNPALTTKSRIPSVEGNEGRYGWRDHFGRELWLVSSDRTQHDLQIERKLVGP